MGDHELRNFVAGYPARESTARIVVSDRNADFRQRVAAYVIENPAPVPALPWLDVNQAIMIADTRNMGDDVMIALDFRSSRADPRVVATDHHWGGRGVKWGEVAPTFTELAERLDL